jgi:hypothetical protein
MKKRLPACFAGSRFLFPETMALCLFEEQPEALMQAFQDWLLSLLLLDQRHLPRKVMTDQKKGQRSIPLWLP